MPQTNTVTQYFNRLGQDIRALPQRVSEIFGLPSEFEKRYGIENWIDPKSILSNIDPALSHELTLAFDREQNPVQNAAYIEPQPIRPLSATHYLQEEATLFWTGSTGPDATRKMQEDLGGKNIYVESPFAGLGHLKEAYLMAKLLSDVTGNRSKMLQPEELLTGLKARMYDRKAMVHGAMQQERLSAEVYDEIFGELKRSYPGLGNEAIVGAAQWLAEFSLAGTGDDTVNQKLHARFARENVMRIDGNPELAKKLLRFICSTDIALTEKPLVELTKKIFSIFGLPDLKISSHANTLRATEADLRETSPKTPNRFFDITPDQGFMPRTLPKGEIAGKKELELFSHLAGPHCGVKAVPSKIIANAYRETFNNLGPIIVTGEFLDSITVKELSEKWSSKSRNVALMVNGNASNAPQIKKAVLDFIAADCPKDVTLALCLFEKGSPEEAEKLFGSDWPTIKAALESHSNLRIVATENKIESAAVSPYIFKWAHYNIGKPPGENAFMSAANGCVEACGYSVMHNEQNNMFFNLDKALVAAYPESNYRRWTELLEGQPEEVRQLAARGLAMKPEHDDFLEYLNNLEREGFGKKTALDGYLRSGHLNSLHILLTQMVQLRDGKMTPEGHEEIERFMVEAQARFNAKIHSEAQQYFGKDYTLSQEELIGIMPQKEYDPDLIFVDRTNEFNEQKKREQITGTLIGLGLLATGAILAFSLAGKKRKKQ